jgi:hypothetical protein
VLLFMPGAFALAGVLVALARRAGEKETEKANGKAKAKATPDAAKKPPRNAKDKKT